MAQAMDESELYSYAKKLMVPIELLRETAKLGRLPVVNFVSMKNKDLFKILLLS